MFAPLDQMKRSNIFCVLYNHSGVLLRFTQAGNSFLQRGSGVLLTPLNMSQ